MTWTINDEFKKGALDGGLAKLNVGSTDANADMRLLATSTELAKGEMSNPAFNAATMSGAVAVANAAAIQTDTTVTQGTYNNIEFRNRDNAVRLAGTVGLIGSGADVEVTDNVITADITEVEFVGFTFAMAFA